MTGKLTMKHGGETACSYERGWDVKPIGLDAQLALEPLLHTEND